MTGYTALLLANILLNNASLQDQILSRLPGDGRDARLSRLVDSLGDLNGFQALVHEKLGIPSGPDSGNTGVIEETLHRIQDII